jgi:hypothetical protein
MARSRRRGGITRTWLMTAACSGARGAAYLNSEWIAASRALRVALPLPRSSSRCCRNGRDDLEMPYSRLLAMISRWISLVPP